MTLTSPPTAVAPLDKGKLAAGISASATTIIVSPIYKTINGVRTKQGFDTSSGCFMITQGDYVEFGTYDSKSVDSTTKITTLSGCVRGRDQTATTATFSGGTGRAWSKGAKIAVVADASYFQSGVYTNVAQTFTANQTLATTNELRFGSSAVAVWKDGSGNLSLKDAANGTKTLTQLAAAGGADEKAKVSSNDTTQGYLNGKLVAGNGIAFTENNDGSNETLTIKVDNPLAVAYGGTGAATHTANAVLTGNGTSAIGSVAPGASGNVLQSNGTTWNSTTPTVTSKIVYASGASSSANANPTSNTAFNTHTYAIPANDLVAGVGYEFEGSVNVTCGTSGTVTIAVMLGSTIIADAAIASVTSAGGHFSGFIMGTASAGASVEVRAGISFTYGISGKAAGDYTAANVATNGGLTLQFGFLYGTSDAGNTATLTMAKIRKVSATPFS